MDTVEHLYIGNPEKLPASNTKTSYLKREVDAITVTEDCIMGNSVHYSKHGGPERVILHCSLVDYNWLLEEQDIIVYPPAFGENLLSKSLSADTVVIGDIYQIGTCLLQVTFPRIPCHKIDICTKRKGLKLIVTQEGRANGWFYRVLQNGKIQKGDAITLVKRLNDSKWTVRLVLQSLYGSKVQKYGRDPQFLEELSKLEGLGRTDFEYKINKMKEHLT